MFSIINSDKGWKIAFMAGKMFEYSGLYQNLPIEIESSRWALLSQPLPSPKGETRAGYGLSAAAERKGPGIWHTQTFLAELTQNLS